MSEYYEPIDLEEGCFEDPKKERKVRKDGV